MKFIGVKKGNALYMIGRKYDELVGSNCGKIVCVGRCALSRCGLTTCISDIIQAGTLFEGIDGIYNPIAMWYQTPYAKMDFDTKPSPVHPNVLEPTKERALVEYIYLVDKLEEGILIEGLKTYAFQKDGDYSGLYKMLDKIDVSKETLDYWIKEAEEDYEG